MSKSDMFLKIVGARAGPIKGESEDSARTGEIDIDGWGWGIQAREDLAGSGARNKGSMRELVVRKKVDSASTALMGAVRNNEPIKSAVLTVRKAGSEAIEYLTITVENGRVTSFDIESAGGGSAEIFERLSLSFQRISVEYVPQGGDGAGQAAMRFETETL